MTWMTENYQHTCLAQPWKETTTNSRIHIINHFSCTAPRKEFPTAGISVTLQRYKSTSRAVFFLISRSNLCIEGTARDCLDLTGRVKNSFFEEIKRNKSQTSFLPVLKKTTLKQHLCAL
ncbi:hypothetical protein ATANTOWER_027788 [Ataeniobius toweri]|uniref:Uncharacterized protein n=1 Tax=Ataeniobius toweri TaxID=208326 RepID=A0ABU7ARU8_9TELE|nr:hypothetical protein [Ataeniobius toweri]